MILKYILCIAAFFALWMTVVSGRPMNDTLTSGLEGLQRVERATSDESPERKPADPDVLGMGFRNRVYQRTPNPTVVNRVATSNESPERKPADPDVLGMGFRNKRMKPREPKNREAKKFLRLLGKTCEGKLPKMTLPKTPEDCRG